MLTMQERIKNSGLTMTARQAERNPNMEDGERMTHWRCTIKCRGTGKRITVIFSMGSGHEGRQPELAEVLDCLTSDAAGYDSARDFEDWCSEYGYSTDSRKAEKTYKACGRTMVQLKKLLGSEYEPVLFETERL